MIYTALGYNTTICEHIFLTAPQLIETSFSICEDFMLSPTLAKEFHYLLLNLVNVNDEDI